MGIVRLHIGVLLGDFVEGALPETEHVGEHVRLAAESELADFASLDILFLQTTPGGFLRVAFADEVESVAQAAIDLEAGVDHLLGRDLIWCASHDVAAAAGVCTAAVFADHDVVDVLRAFVFERGFNSGEEFNGAEVDVLIEGKAEFEQEPLLQDAGLHVGVTDRAEIDGIVLLQGLDFIVVDNLACGEVAFTAEIIILELH